MTLFFDHNTPLRTGFRAVDLRPGICSILVPNKRGKLRLVRAVLPAAALPPVGTRTKKKGR